MKPENFEDEAQAIAAKLRTAYGYVRPAKRRCVNNSAVHIITGNTPTWTWMERSLKQWQLASNEAWKQVAKATYAGKLMHPSTSP